MLHLYGIIDGRHPPELMPAGLENRAPVVVPYDGLSAVTGHLQFDRPLASEAHLRQHFRVIEALMASHTVLPARFGSVFAGRAELASYLALTHGTHAGDLQRLRGKIELGMKAVWLSAPARISGTSAFAAGEFGPGTSYLAGKHAKAAYRVDRQREAEELASTISAPLALYATEVKWRSLPAASGQAGVSMAFLLSKERLEAFRTALAAFRAAKPSLGILCTGPWPPYSFVSAAGQTGLRPSSIGDAFDAELKNRAAS